MRWFIPALLLTFGGLAQAAPAISLRSIDNPATPLSREFEIDLPRPASIQVTCDEVGGQRERHLIKADGDRHYALAIRGLKASTRYSCAAETRSGPLMRSEAATFTTRPLPPDLVPPQITTNRTDSTMTGYTLYNYAMASRTFNYTANYLVILDMTGNVRWFLSGVGGGDIDATFLGDGRLLYGGDGNNYVVPTIVGLDKKIRFQGTIAKGSPYELEGSYNHDMGLSSDGQSLFALAYEYVDAGWQGFEIKQIDLATNQVTWSWDSVVDGAETGELPEGSSSNPDPYHANAIFDRWEDGHLYLYVSLRNMSELLKIDYETREVVWHLGLGGDFQLLEADGTPAADDRWFFEQHDAKLYGNELVLYDNGISRRDHGGEASTRALKLILDEDNFTARISLEHWEDNWIEPIWGGHDKLANGNSLVAMGHCTACGSPDSHLSALVELNPEGVQVWRADFHQPTEMLYRAQRIEGCAIFANTTMCPTLK